MADEVADHRPTDSVESDEVAGSPSDRAEPAGRSPQDSRPAAGEHEHTPTADGGTGRSGPQQVPGSEDVRLSTLPWALTDEPDDRALPPWFRRAIVLILGLVIASRVLVWGFGELESFWYTLFFAFFIGLALEPIVTRLAARGMRRGLGTILVMVGLALSAAAFFAVFGNLLADQLAQLVRSLPDTLDQIVAWVNDKFGTQLNPTTILDTLGLGAGDIAKIATNLGVGLLSVLGTAIGWVFSAFTIALFAFYFAADGPKFRRAVASWLPPARQRTFLTVWDISTQKAGGYVISRGILAIVSAVFHGIVFYLLDLPYWLPLALWVGLVSQFIPTIGTYLAGALPIIIALVEGEPLKALAVLAAVTAYQQVENYFVAPRVTRSTLEIHPAVAFGSVIVGSALFGAMGALLAIPVVATIQSIISVYGHRYELVGEFWSDGSATDRERAQAMLRATDDTYRPGI
jgi:predicted PurR-regulated permease PerM